MFRTTFLVSVLVPCLSVAAPVPVTGGPTVTPLETTDTDLRAARCHALLAPDGSAYYLCETVPRGTRGLFDLRPSRVSRVDRCTGKEDKWTDVEIIPTAIPLRLHRHGSILGHWYDEGTDKHRLALYDTKKGNLLRTVKLDGEQKFDLHYSAVLATGDGRCLATGRGGSLHLVDLDKPDTGTPLDYLGHLPNYGKTPTEWTAVGSLQLTANDTKLVWLKGALLNPDTDQEVEASNVVVFDVKANKVKAVHPLYDHVRETGLRSRRLLASPDGSLAAFTVADHTGDWKGAREDRATRHSLRLIDLGNGKETFRTTFDGAVKEFWFDPSGRFVAAVTQVKSSCPVN